MRHIEKPQDNQREVFLLCISSLRDKVNKQKLEACIDDIVQGACDYENKMLNNQIHTASKQSVVSAKDMIELYTRKFVGKTSPARKYYDKLILSAPKGLCPLCGQRNASTIDHYLPKSLYPLYSVTMVNLIPACKDCNKDKRDSEIRQPEDAIIHPYFDVSIDDQIWLSCRVEEKDNRLVFLFDVVKPDMWDDLLYKRMKNHFDKLKLGMLYSTHAAAEFENVRWFLNIRLKKSTVEVKRWIEDNIESYSKVAKNSWQVSMYRALSLDFEKLCSFLNKCED